MQVYPTGAQLFGDRAGPQIGIAANWQIPQLVVLLGPGTPSTNDVVLVRRVGSRWVCDFFNHCPVMDLHVFGCRVSAFGETDTAGVPNAPYTITDLDGNVMQSGTTDALGHIDFANNGYTTGRRILNVNARRFNAYSKEFDFACGAQQVFDLCAEAGLAPGYACCSAFPYPLPTTLFYTDQNGTRPMGFVGPVSCSGGVWQACYDAPATVGNKADCTDNGGGVTPVLVSGCGGASLKYATFGCPPLNPIGDYTGCVCAPTGFSFFPVFANGCVQASEPATLSCATLDIWGNGCVNDFGTFIFGNRGTHTLEGSGAASLLPPDGFLYSGTWPAAPCAPVTGPFTITE